MKTIKEFLHGLPSIYISLCLLVILTLILYIGNPSFLSVYNLKTIASATAILLAVGLGQTTVILTGGVDLSVGGIMSLISVVYILSVIRFGLLGFPIALLAGCAAGLLNGISVLSLIPGDQANHHHYLTSCKLLNITEP